MAVTIIDSVNTQSKRLDASFGILPCLAIVGTVGKMYNPQSASARNGANCVASRRIMKLIRFLLCAYVSPLLLAQVAATEQRNRGFSRTKAFEPPSVVYNFNQGLPPGTAVYGSATVNTASGILELNPNVGSQQSAFLVTDLTPGRVVHGFAATFRARMIPGSPTPGAGSVLIGLPISRMDLTSQARKAQAVD